jgi:hypothetical protein
MRATATPTQASAVLPLRVDYRREMNCQIVHDSIHRRPGWTKTYELSIDDASAGFGTVAIGGPWTGEPTICRRRSNSDSGSNNCFFRTELRSTEIALLDRAQPHRLSAACGRLTLGMKV